MPRGTGKTTEQMLNAPKGALFVWCNDNLTYPIGLAIKLNRGDLEIVSPAWMNDYRYIGRSFTGVVADHALYDNKSDEDCDQLEYHVARANRLIKETIE